jgi:hypothetical protein
MNDPEENIEGIVGQDDEDDAPITPSNEDTALDWKPAAKKLKKATEEITDSLDDYFKKVEINALRTRYNNKERSKSLYDAIMALK